VDQKLTFTVEEARKLLGLSRGLAYEACRAGWLPCLRVGRRLLISRKALECLLEQAGANERSQNENHNHGGQRERNG